MPANSRAMVKRSSVPNCTLLGNSGVTALTFGVILSLTALAFIRKPAIFAFGRALLPLTILLVAVLLDMYQGRTALVDVFRSMLAGSSG